MTGEQLKRLWKRLANDRGEVATGAATLPPEIQEKLARLDKLEKDNKAMGYRLRHHENVVKSLGDRVQRDEQGNPIGLITDDPAPVREAPASAFVNGQHPFAGLLDDPATVDAYYDGILAKKGYLTRAEAEKLADARAQMYAGTVLGNARVWRNFDKLVTNEKYKALSDMKSDLSMRTARILQERRYGAPMSEEAGGFDEWRFREIGDLQLAADLGRLEIAEETKANAASTASATEAQAGAALTAAPAGSGGAAAGGGRPDFSQMGSTDDVLDALDKASPGGPPN